MLTSLMGGYDVDGIEMLLPAPVSALAPENISAINGFSTEGEWPFYYEMITKDGKPFLRLANRQVIAPDTAFEGTIVIDWQVENRGREPGYHLDMPLTVSVSPLFGEQRTFIASNILSLDINTVHDSFSPELSRSKINATSGLESDWRDYIWVYYTGNAGITRKTMPLKNGEYILDLPENVKVMGLGDTSEDGKYHIPLNDPEAPQFFNFTVGFPKEAYDGKEVTIKYALAGTYLDGEVLYAEADTSFTHMTLSAADYDFTYTGDKFAIASICSDDTSWQQLSGKKGGVVQDVKTTVYSLAYPDDQFDYTILLDWQDITSNENKFKVLGNDDYAIQSITGPTSITGADNKARHDQNEIKGELIGIDAEGNETSYGIIGINQTIPVSSNDKSFKIVYRAVTDYAIFHDINLSIKYSIKGFDENGTSAPNLLPLMGRVRSVSGLLVSYGGDHIINEATESEYIGNQGAEIAARDIERYGRYIQRGYAEFSYSNYQKAYFEYLQKINVDPAADAVSSTSGFTQRFHLNYRINIKKNGDEDANDPILKSFSLFALLPEGWSAPSSIAAEGWQDLPEVQTIIVTNNYKQSGRTLLRFDIDNIDAILTPNEDIDTSYSYEFNMEFNAMLDRMSFYDYGSDGYIMDVYGVAHTFESDKYIEHKDGTSFTIEDKDDIDSDGNTAEEIAVNSISINITNTLATHLEASEQVSSNYMNNAWSKSAEIHIGDSYQYRLNFMTAGTPATDVMFFDNIESSSSWEGIFDSVDVSALEAAGYHPVVWGNINRTNDYKRVSAAYGWEPISKFSDSYLPKTIAVKLSGDTVPASSVLSVIIKMKSPNDSSIIQKAARDQYTVSYTNANNASSTLTSSYVNVVPVSEEGTGTLVLNKIDKDSKLPLSGAIFELDSSTLEPLETNITVGSYSLSAGEYYLYETTTPNGYYSTKRSTHFTIEPGKITHLIIENEKITATLNLTWFVIEVSRFRKFSLLGVSILLDQHVKPKR